MDIIMQRAAVFLIFLGLGYLCKKIRLLKKEHFHVVSGMVFYITLPCAIISSFNSMDLKWSSFGYVLSGLGCGLLLVFLGYCIGRTPGQKAFFMLCTQGFNIGSFALPYLQMMIGTEAVVIACLFDAGNSFLVCGGAFAMAYTVFCGRSGNAKEGREQGMTVFRKMLSSVPLDTQIVMCILGILSIRLPILLMEPIQKVGAVNGYLSMFMVGLGLEFSISKADIKIIRKVIGGRYAVTILLSVIVFFLPFLNYEVRKIIMLLLVSPVSISNSVFAERLFQRESREVSLACGISSITVAISIVIMTALLVLM